MEMTTNANWERVPAPMNLFDLARAGDLNGIRYLLELGFEINEKNSKGYSALMLAAYHANFKLCAYLIEQGADVNSIDESSNSILMGVAYKGHLEIAKLLIDHGAELRYRNNKGQSALDYAQLYGHEEMVRLLKRELRGGIESLRNWAAMIVGG